MGRLQNEDFKSSAELVSAGGAASQLLNDSKIYITAQGINDTLSNAITNGQIGAGGTKNYIISGNTFESNTTTGWSLARTTLSNKFPNQVSGSWTSAAGTLSFATVGSGNQLAGNYSASLTSSAASTAGDMVVSNAITLDQEAQGAVQGISFFYKVSSGSSNLDFSGTSNNSLAVAVYDVTNSAWIQPAGTYNLVNKGSVGKFTGTFQVPINTTSIRLALFFPNASAGAFAVTVDDFVLGPQVSVSTPPMSDCQGYIPTITGFGTPTNIAFRSRRVGDSLEVWGYFQAGTPTGVAGTVTLGYLGGNGNVTIDTAKLPTNGVVGFGGYGNSSTTLFSMAPLATGAFNYLNFGLQTSTTNALGAVNGNAFAPNAFIQFHAKIPIVGWSSNTVSSADTDTRVIACQAYLSTNWTQTSSGNYQKVPFNATGFDTSGSFSTSLNRFIIPVTGVYRISANMLWNANATGIRAMQLWKNGSFFSDIGASSAQGVSASGVICNGTNTAQANAGDYFEIYASQNSGGSLATFGGGASNYVNFERLSGPAVVQATDSVVSRYTTAAGQSIPNNLSTIVVFGDKVFDSTNSMNPSTGVYTVPVAGTYRVQSLLQFASAAFVTGTQYNVSIFKNGALFSILGGNFAQASNTSAVTINGAGTVKCIAGDTIVINAYQNSGSSRSLFVDNNWNFVCIERIGN